MIWWPQFCGFDISLTGQQHLKWERKDFSQSCQNHRHWQNTITIAYFCLHEEKRTCRFIEKKKRKKNYYYQSDQHFIFFPFMLTHKKPMQNKAKEIKEEKKILTRHRATSSSSSWKEFIIIIIIKSTRSKNINNDIANELKTILNSPDAGYACYIQCSRSD